MRMRHTLGTEKYDPRIILAAIDDQSIKKIGNWPFPRKVYAKLMDKLKKFGARILIYDVFFSEKSLTCPGRKSDDALMASSIQNFQSFPQNKVILGHAFSPHPLKDSPLPEVMYAFALPSKEESGVKLKNFYSDDTTFPIPLIHNQASGVAHLQAISDLDGLFRHYPLVAQSEDIFFPSLALMAYQFFTNHDVKLILKEDSKQLQIPDGNLSLNWRGETKVRWSGTSQSFPMVSLIDILSANDNDPAMRKIFKDHIVFIGSTALGAHDLRHTPVDPLMPGVYFHMNMLKMLLDKKIFKPTQGIDPLFLVIFCPYPPAGVFKFFSYPGGLAALSFIAHFGPLSNRQFYPYSPGLSH